MSDGSYQWLFLLAGIPREKDMRILICAHTANQKLPFRGPIRLDRDANKKVTADDVVGIACLKHL